MKQLSSLKSPWLHLLVAKAPAVDDLALSLQSPKSRKRALVRKLRGKAMPNAAACFNEFAAALQFPAHFGSNWDALDECLNDLEWLSAGADVSHYVLLISNADLVLNAERERRATLFSLLSAGGEEWSRRETPLHTVLACATDELARALGEELDGYDLSVDEFQLKTS
ncbi:MAG TPA: barstar family protein [Planctomycetota bacterium]|nr:barstar family protein [Planctomycetota bacterium]